MISHHCISVLVIIYMCRQIIVYQLECFYSIIVICIDDCEWSVDLIHTAVYGMCRSPRFYTSFRYFISFRNIINILICVCNIHVFLHTLSYMLFEFVFDLVFDNKHNFFESCPLCIIHRKVHDDMSVVIDRI